MLAANAPNLECAVKFRDSVNLFVLPKRKGGISALKAGKVNAGTVGAPKDAVLSQIVGDVKHSVPILNFRWPLNQYFSLQQSPHCPPLPLLKYTEQLRNGPRNLNGSNRLFSLNVPFLPSGAISRQTVAAHPSHDNDNFDPLEAA